MVAQFSATGARSEFPLQQEGSAHPAVSALSLPALRSSVATRGLAGGTEMVAAGVWLGERWRPGADPGGVCPVRAPHNGLGPGLGVTYGPRLFVGRTSPVLIS